MKPGTRNTARRPSPAATRNAKAPPKRLVKKVVKRIVRGQPSWRIASPHVEAFVTELGGHLGPVSFRLGGKRIEPYSVAPWAEERIDPATPNILRVLRGDFFCMPFGGNETPYRGERHPVHGETANARWELKSRF